MQFLIHLHVNKTNFHMKGFALGLTLKQRQKATRKLSIRKMAYTTYSMVWCNLEFFTITFAFQCLILYLNLFVFTKESYFHWTFGVLEGDCFGAVEVDTGRSILFVPNLPQEYAVWMGKWVWCVCVCVCLCLCVCVCALCVHICLCLCLQYVHLGSKRGVVQI